MILFQRLNDAWSELPQARCYTYKISSFIVEINCHDNALAAKLTRAFAHLATERRPSDLTIRLWSGPKLPSLDWNLIQTNGYRGYQEPPFYFHYFETIGALSAIDTERGIAYYAIRDPGALPWWVSGSPLQTIFHVWFKEKGIQLTHSACITDGKSGILLAGKGGSGKSTTVLSCLREGLGTLGEDYILLAPERAYSLYQTAKWQPHTRSLFPSYESHIANPDTANEEKALIHYVDLFPAQLIPSSPIHAVVSLKVGASSSLQRADFRTSLQSLLLSTVMQLPHPDPRTASLLHARIKPLSHYRLLLGPDLKANVHLLRSLFQ